MEKQLTQLEVVNKVIMYSFNSEYKFLNLVFDSHLAKHFESKWYAYNKQYNDSQRAFMQLYTAMSDNNRKTLINYILNK